MNDTAVSKPATQMDMVIVAKTFFAVLIPLAIILSGIIAFLYLKDINNRRIALNLKESNRLITKKEVISSYIQAIATDVLTVSKHYELRMMMDNNESRYRDSLGKEFLWFCKIKKIYDQVRFLDEQGMEILRVNFNNGAPGIVPLEELQPKGERYYFQDTFQLAESEIFVSPFDLNIEYGKIEQPIKPMIRFGTPIFDSKGRKRGVVLLNYLGSHLINTLAAISENEIGNTLLLNSEGYYLRGLSHDDEWGFMYANKKDRTFARIHPEAWQKISRAESGQFHAPDGVYTFTTIRPFTEAQVSSTGSGEPYAPSEKLLEGREYYWKLVSFISPDRFYGEGGPRLPRVLAIYGALIVLLALGSGSVAYLSVKRKQAEKEVRNHRDYLKQLVDQRTAELTSVNEQLQSDINERRQVEAALRESEEKYRSMMEAMDDAAYICSDDFRITYMNSAMRKRTGYDATGEICYKVIHGLDGRCQWCVHDKVMNGAHIKTEVVSPKDKRIYHISNSPIFHMDGSVSKLTIFRDNTDVKKIEAQLQQAQKMESVGRLAGGVAHDYNNALSVIIGFTELAKDQIGSESPLRANLDEILKAAANATNITRQLLAFASKQPISPKVLDLNNNVENMLKMLQRLIGEDLELAWLPGENLWPVKIDSSQINQILANLCVNARDAIKGVGKIAIETKNTRLDEAYCAEHISCVPGEFVLLAVSDNGCGMEKKILDNIFEPFFTTKDLDKGTGLGLATVYGIVKQNHGFIDVYSEPGQGSTFSIYLPRHEGEAIEFQEQRTEDTPSGKGETILLVEDDLALLKLGLQILDRLGYAVLTAGTPSEALRICEEYSGRIHMLVSDIIMPEMDGRELAEKMKSSRPDIKLVFMSGYAADVIVHRGVHDTGVGFINKPFSRRDLAIAIRKALDE